MKEIEYFKYDKIADKLDFLIKISWELLQKKLQYGFIEINKEASLQLQYANILQSLITTSKYSDNEIIKVILEKTVYIQNNKPQEVDIIIETVDNNQPYVIAIEMKCYRTKTSSGGNRGAMDIFVKDVYEDIEVLENYKSSNRNIKKTYFLAMTDYQNFVLPKDKSAKYWDYDISDGFNLEGPKDFSTPIGGKDVAIHIEGKYNFNWSKIDSNNGVFYFLLLE